MSRQKVIKVFFRLSVSLAVLLVFWQSSTDSGLAETRPGGSDEAVEILRLELDAETVGKGYTLSAGAQDFKVGVVAGAVTEPVLVVLKNIPANHLASDKTASKLSEILEYDMRKKLRTQNSEPKTNGSILNVTSTAVLLFEKEMTESLGVLEKPIYVAIKFNSPTTNKKIVHFWNKPTAEWLPLPSSTDFDKQLARVVIHLPYARLAVFEELDIHEGPASWYAAKDCNCAASNVYKRGTKLRVTNISGSSRHGRSVIVTVNDYGPDPKIHPDRVIDLDKTVYQQLAASLGSGLMNVRVEPVNAELATRY